MDAVRSHQRRSVLAQAALLAVAVLALAVLALALLLGPAPSVARWGNGGCVLAGAGALCWRLLVLLRRGAGDRFRAARLVAARVPGVSLDLLAALELRAALAHADAFSQELAQAYLSGSDARAATLDARHVVDGRPTRIALLFALSAAALAALGVLVAPQGFRAVARLVRTDAASALMREPITGDVELTYRYPAYTGLQPRTVSGSGGEISAPVGTVVDLRTRSDRPVAQAALALDGATVPLRVEHQRDLSGSLVVRTSGKYTVVFLGRTGRELVRGPELPVTAQPDAPPKVSLLLPASDLEVDPASEVTLRWEATDDYGLTSLSLVYQLPGGAETRLPLPVDEARRSQGTWKWALAGLKLTAGDRVTYFLEAVDNDAVDGPQKGTSRAQTLRVYSASEHRTEAIRRVDALWERLVSHLADRMEGPDRARTRDIAAVTAQTRVDESGQALAGELSLTGRQLARERDRPEALAAAAGNIGERLSRSVRTTSEARRIYLRVNGRSPESDPGARLSRAAGEEIGQVERDVLYLESLLDRQRMEEIGELTETIARDQRELARLIEQFQATHDPALQEQILRQVASLRRRIDELMQRRMEMARGIHDEHFNLDSFRDLVQQQDLAGGLREIERLLKEGKTEEALARLQQLLAQTEQQMRDTNRQLSRPDPELVKRFTEFAESLKSTRAEQARVASETRAIRDRYRDQLRERLRAKGGALRESMRRDAEAVAQDYRKVRPGELGPRTDRALEHAQGELENLKNALRSEDYDLAADAARAAGQSADEIARDAEQKHALDEAYRNPPDMREQSKRTAQRMEQDAQKLRDIQRKLQSLFPAAGSQLSWQDRQRLEQLTSEERSLERRAQELVQKMQALNQAAPLFGEQGVEQLSQVGERMASASERLEARDPARGYGEQKAALDGLEQLEQQLQQSQRGGGGLPLPLYAANQEGGNDVSQQKVDIPDADPGGYFLDFRKDLLEAMKQGTPERYREQVKSYYEELVR